MMVMHPFFGKPKILAKYRARMEAHIAAYELVQGVGFQRENGETRGCFVGCTLDKYEPLGFLRELNIPVQVASVCDAIHEGLPNYRIAEFASRFFAEMNLASDASLWWPKFAIQLLTHPVHGVRQHANNPDMLDELVRLYQRVVAEDTPAEKEWDAARAIPGDAAWDASRAAAWGAARATLWGSAAGAAYAAYHAARSAARVAAQAAVWTTEEDADQEAAWGTAWDTHFIWQAETLLSITRA